MKFSFIIIFIQLGFLINAQQKKILFIGNSLTYYYEMPKMVETMLKENGDNIIISQHTFPGMQIQHHVQNGGAKAKIDETNWDFVILQTGTYGYLVPENVQKNVIPSILKIKEYCKNSKTRFYLFSTWVMKLNFPAEACFPKLIITNEGKDFESKFCSPKFQNKEEEKEYLEKQYNLISDKSRITLTKHYKLEFDFENKYPFFNMWDDENGHPSKIGSYLNACIFFKMLSDQSLKDIKSNFQINENTAKIIRNFVEDNYTKY